jgi:hypothetical protein
MGRVEAPPTSTVPKSSEAGEKLRLDGLAEPRRLMKSSVALESELISRALMRVPGSCGVKVRLRVQLAPATRVVQLPAAVKSGVV